MLIDIVIEINGEFKEIRNFQRKLSILQLHVFRIVDFKLMCFSCAVLIFRKNDRRCNGYCCVMPSMHFQSFMEPTRDVRWRNCFIFLFLLIAISHIVLLLSTNWYFKTFFSQQRINAMEKGQCPTITTWEGVNVRSRKSTPTATTPGQVVKMMMKTYETNLRKKNL